MGILSKKNEDRSKKIREIFNSLREAGIPAFFPRGEKQAEIVVFSYCRICGLTKAEIPPVFYPKMLMAYVDVMSAIGSAICDVPEDAGREPFNKRLANMLLAKYKQFILDESMAATITAYTAANMHNPLYAFDGKENKLYQKYESWLKTVDLLNTLDALTPHGDETDEGYYFENVEELAVYGQIISQGGSVVWLKGDKYTNLYQKGYAHYEQGEFKEAIAAFTDSLKFNPVGIRARFEMAECYIRLKKYKSAVNILYAMTRFLARPEDQARFYRRIGVINAEKKKYLCAAACYVYSQWFFSHPSVDRELSYISSKSNVNIDSLKANPLLVLKNFEVPILSIENSDMKNIKIDS